MKKCRTCCVSYNYDEYYKDKKGFIKPDCKRCYLNKTIEYNKKNRKKTIEINYLEGEVYFEFEENYFISNLGRVYVKEHFYKNKYVAGRYPKLTKVYGYFIVATRVRQILVHRLVAKYFIENKDENKKTVNHKDSVRSNNRYDNLEWTTLRENILHGVKKDNYAKKMKREDIFDVRENCKTPSDKKKYAEKYNVSLSNIKRILNRQIWDYI